VRRTSVIVVGGGFGGLACARRLDRGPVDVLLLDSDNYHLFTPLLYQVATSLLNPSDIAYPFRAIFRRSNNVRFRQARVSSVDLNERNVHTNDGHLLNYDFLVLATGSTNNYFGHRDLEQWTFSMKSLGEAVLLRDHVLTCLELADREDDENERRRLLTFLVVGGGPTGVEYAGALIELMKLVLGRDYPSLRATDARIVLVEGLDRLLPTFPKSLGRYAERILTKRGVEVRLNTLVERADGLRMHLSTQQTIETHTAVWSAGVRPNDVLDKAAVSRSPSGRVEVDEHLRLGDHPEVFVLGDLAGRTHRGQELPMLSPFAIQGGRHAARMILEETSHGREAAERIKNFRYIDKGTMATIGRNSAVGRFKGIRLRGFVGWVGWLVVHIYYLIGFRNRLVVLLMWGWNYIKKDRPIRIITGHPDDPLADRLLTAPRFARD
jgi:NADH:ubiquinone reductase (H+-translocating)